MQFPSHHSSVFDRTYSGGGWQPEQRPQQQLLSLIIDQRCFEENAFLGHGLRNFVLDAALEVVHIAWWGMREQPEPSAPLNHLIELELHVITDALAVDEEAHPPPPHHSHYHQPPPIMQAGNTATSSSLTTTHCRLMLPRTPAHNVSAIRDACGTAYQLKQSVPHISAGSGAPSASAVFTNAQVEAIRSVVLRDSSSQLRGGPSGGGVDDVHVVLLTSVFDAKSFGARMATALPPLVSLSSQRIQVTVLFLDHLAKASMSQLSLGPSIAVQRFPLTLPPRRCIAQMVRPVLEQWAASCLTPSDLPVTLSIGHRSVQCVASCALVSSMSRWQLPVAAFANSTVIHGWDVLDNVYQDPSSSAHHQNQYPPTSQQQLAPPSSAAGYRLRVERWVPKDAIDAASLMGMGWYLSPHLGVMTSLPSSGDNCVGGGGGSAAWWKALVDASALDARGGSPNVLILSSAGGSFVQAAACCIGLRVHEYVGMFSPDGASMLLRAIAPREVIREPPRATAPFPLRATEAMVNEVRELLTSTQSATSTSGSGNHSYHGDMTTIIGALQSDVCRRRLQIISNQQHPASTSASKSTRRTAASVTTQHGTQHRGVSLFTPFQNK